MKNIQPIQESGIFSIQIGNKLLVATTVEPSSVNLDKFSYLWFSENGKDWKELVAYIKDLWNMIYFQFGSIRFPHYADDINTIVYTGRSLYGLDGMTAIVEL